MPESTRPRDAAMPSKKRAPQPPVNLALAAACVLATATFFIHVIGGGASVWQPIAESDLPDEVRLVTLAVWHMASVALGVSAVGLGLGSVPRFATQSRFLVILVAVMWIGFALCFVGTAITNPGNDVLAALPQPVLLLPVGILGIIGSRRIA
ncbi:MAG: hypothetical protein ACOH1M_03520 [Rhodoglobus sp.]